jgi:hypothetical protein
LRLESLVGAGCGGRRLLDGVSHRLASTGACDVAVDPGDGAGGAQPAQRERARQHWPQSRALRVVASEVAVYEIP